MDFRFLRLDILLPFLISPLALLAAFKAYQRPSQKNEVLNFLHALLFALRPLHNLLNGLFRSESSLENDGTAFALYSLQTSLIMGITLIQGFNLPRALLLPFFLPLSSAFLRRNLGMEGLLCPKRRAVPPAIHSS
eukprot:TRINITY_DN21720_c0_g1_i1.p1 TRINITY_DN21720_c0_g1~~TRINITY_DN21720_c0_g1_i1.p1  ORF type:complete len:135 (-),score=29.36 TRINITY_DN21720_c0_g1_i1:416-820(-)